MKRLIGGFIVTLTLCNFASAQVVEATKRFTRQQITLQGSGVFTKKVNDSDIAYKPTSSGGALGGYRFNFNRWLGAEGDFDVFRDSQRFSTSTATTAVRTNVYAATGSAVISLPNPLTRRFQSFVSVGGGALVFDPRDTYFVPRQTRNVIAFGGGVDIPVSRRIAIRAQARTFMYKSLDFELSSLRTNKYFQTMIPSVGVVFKF
jgi:opacity protein-like surface antigen